MRGKVQSLAVCFNITGITPAYAGKRSVPVRKFHGSWDHPRLCGEKSLGLTVYLHVSGSPPPMRGKVRLALICHFSLRITPAYAGKSTAEANTIRATKDHPRLCGEKFLTTEKINLMLGSPPPMRGKVEMRW